MSLTCAGSSRQRARDAEAGDQGGLQAQQSLVLHAATGDHQAVRAYGGARVGRR
jgi:hypothetical protein